MRLLVLAEKPSEVSSLEVDIGLTVAPHATGGEAFQPPRREGGLHSALGDPVSRTECKIVDMRRNITSHHVSINFTHFSCRGKLGKRGSVYLIRRKDFFGMRGPAKGTRKRLSLCKKCRSFQSTNEKSNTSQRHTNASVIEYQGGTEGREGGGNNSHPVIPKTESTRLIGGLIPFGLVPVYV
jgi:hypothetical protein